VNQFRAHFWKRCEVFDLARLQVHPEEVKILVSFGVLHVNDEIVSFPKIIADIAVLFGSDPLGLATRCWTYPNVHPCFPRCEIGECFAIWRKQITAADRIFEKITERNFWWWRLRCRDNKSAKNKSKR